MNLLVVSQYFWPENFRINDITKSLIEKGVDVEVLTGQPNYPRGEVFSGYRAWGCEEEFYHKININRIPIVARGKGGLRLAINYLSFVVSGLIFGSWMLRKKKIDVIFIYAPSPILQAIPALFIGWLKGSPVVLWVQDLWPESLSATGHVKNKTVLKLVEWVVRYIYKHSDLLLVQSKAFQLPVSELASNTPVKYYPNSVDASFTLPITGSIPDIDGLDNGFSVMFAGNIGTAQAIEVIIEAASLLKEYTDIHFVVLGEGSSWQWMQNERRKYKLKNLHLPGSFPSETMPAFMQKASALLVTLADQDIFRLTIPSKVQTYLAAGRPILGSLNGEGARLIAESGSGIAVAAENGPALADAILNLYRMDSKDREAMGRRGRLYYSNHFKHDMLVDQLIAHLSSVCDCKEKFE